MIRRQFDTLYRESVDSRSGRVMAICLHPFVIGVPHRIGALDDALKYIGGHDGVWKATGSQIIEHYLKGETFDYNGLCPGLGPGPDERDLHGRNRRRADRDRRGKCV